MADEVNTPSELGSFFVFFTVWGFSVVLEEKNIFLLTSAGFSNLYGHVAAAGPINGKSFIVF